MPGLTKTGAESRIRTGTVLPPQAPEACASTNFAISATISYIQDKDKDLNEKCKKTLQFSHFFAR